MVVEDDRSTPVDCKVRDQIAARGEPMVEAEHGNRQERHYALRMQVDHRIQWFKGIILVYCLCDDLLQCHQRDWATPS